MEERKLRAWVITNLGGVNLVFAGKYKGGLPIFYTKKEADADTRDLTPADKLKIERKIVPGRKVVPCTITYRL
jgi:hypothetical protein